MLLFVLCALLTFAMIAIIAVPYLRNLERKAETADYNLKVYKDQLAELERDVTRGLIVSDEAEAAKVEIERRMLVEATVSESSSGERRMKPPILFLAFLGIMPVVAGIIYFMQGSPDQPATPFASREDLPTAAAAADGMHSGMGGMVETLQVRLAENPDDVEGWALLARSLTNLNRYPEAIEAYREANRRVGGRDRRLAAEYAEALVIGNDGVVGPEALMIFNAFIEEDPNDPQAMYYLALAKAQDGDMQGALNDWRRLIENSPEDAPWLPVVQRQLEALMSEAGETGPMPSPQAVESQEDRFVGPTTQDIQAAQQLSSDQQSQMIDGMVAGLAARLEENPDDLAGWRRLARSYTVLGKPEEAKSAYQQVLRLAPGDADATAALNELGQ